MTIQEPQALISRQELPPPFPSHKSSDASPPPLREPSSSSLVSEKNFFDQSGEGKSEGKSEGEGGKIEEEKSDDDEVLEVVEVGKTKSDSLESTEVPRPSFVRKKRASTLTNSPTPSLAGGINIQPLTIDDLLSDTNPQPDNIDKIRNQIRVRVMNVLRHWLEDHWQDFENYPNLLYQLIKW
eukprot:CAMPEP_0201508388 /NCGR_PEP_ID=MMETSP0161_2-20130828/1772_1 /ASSEMBLY_ACC=CAM_ASM_000251 /TAXON_ID=180227 /ORGANISM="Neoparamoeba aestuarina, Strain SoJaBio B1-5/56/2" /LENGTH=181 /DNA_ID=CAMNT_0047903039 /DNA_START=256 /DNA_END=797 /DNA_ORIENTATION=+